MNSGEQNKLFILIDGHSLAFRAYYAFAKSRSGPLRTSTGIPTSVCFGFLNSLMQLLETQKPTYLAVAFDLAVPSFRHEADVNYKANRQETPEEFRPDLTNLQSLLAAMNIPIVTSPGYEADDVLGTLAKQAGDNGYTVKILTGDRDLFQLVDEEKKTTVLYLDINAVKSTSGQGYTEFNSQAVTEKLGVTPKQVVDFKALCGDKSDNIPGVRGIGEKTAIDLLKKYDNLDDIYTNLESIKGMVKTKLLEGKTAAESSRYLAKIALDAPVSLEEDKFRLRGFDRRLVKPLLERFELKKILQKLDQIQQHLGGTPTLELTSDADSNQLSLFDLPPISPPVLIAPDIIDTIPKLDALLAKLTTFTNPQFPVAWDTETTDLNPRVAKLVGIGCCWGKELNAMAYIPIGHSTGDNLNLEIVLEKLRPILAGDNYPKVFQNAKFDIDIFYHQGITVKGLVFDTMVASYVLHTELTNNLEDLCNRYLTGITSLSYKSLGIPAGKTIADLDIPTTANYCGLDAYATYLLREKLQSELNKIPPLYQLFSEIESPLVMVLWQMENYGIKINVNYLKNLSQQLERDLADIEKNAYESIGETFNLSSPKQLSEILFERLALNRKKSRKTKTGYSTDQSVLEKLQGDHPLIDYILEHRTLSKLKSTYVDALPKLAEPKTARVHTDFNQTITSTGRLSSSNPNLQNIPIRSEFSRRIRQAFIPEDGYLLVSADYSQIELRILAHLSQEPVLLEAYRSNQDVHKVTARLLFDKSEITPEERSLGKTINFGVIYGMGAQKFARESKLTVEQGRKFIEKYHQRYAQVFEYLENSKKQAIAQGYVETILGRRRYFNFDNPLLKRLRGLPLHDIDLDSLKLNNEEAQLLRSAANAPIQGSSADIIKVAMVKLAEVLQNYRARLLLQVHDELVLEVPREEWPSLESKIKTTMEEAVSLTVPLLVEIKAGDNWMETK
ncbi:MAG: DNA polymerase I [Microcystis aeruginosa BK11-02]|nr:DNA polymerase I [Microcystis aeruginosa BK11-02]